MTSRSASPLRRRFTALRVIAATAGVVGAAAALVAALPARAGSPETPEAPARVEPAPHAGAPETPEAAARVEPKAGPRRAERVLIISEDGLRGDALSQLHLPWHEALYRGGAWSWKARTIRTASTLPS